MNAEAGITFSYLAFFTGTIVEFALASIKESAACLLSFLSSFTRSEYLKVLRVCSQHPLAGDTLAIITVLHLPPVNESFRT